MRHLLPFEVQLCTVLGISKEEYFYFDQLTQSYNGERPKEYELVPAVENDALTVAIISLVIGVATTVASVVLAPKPKAPQLQAQTAQTPTAAPDQQQALTPFTTGGASGRTRYTQNSGFDSVQQLANLGETVPVVFANRQGNVGGVRVKTTLLWSQLLSEVLLQELSVLLLLSAGKLAARPDFSGYSIGDQVLKNYTNAKLALYFRADGGRVKEVDRYDEGTLPARPSGITNYDDVFSITNYAGTKWLPDFCGTRSPSTQTQFGCFSPLPNSTPYRVNYEMTLIPNVGGTVPRDSRRKVWKVFRDYPSCCGITARNGDTITYTVKKYTISGPDDEYYPWGLSDVNVAVTDLREATDDQIELNAIYMAGSAIVVCTNISTAQPWEDGDDDKTYTFRILEDGEFDVFADPTALDVAPGLDPNLEAHLASYEAFATKNPTWGTVLQRLAIGTISNNRACDATEIGLKSTVWKRIGGFPNVNSRPEKEAINYYESQNASMSLGGMNRYLKRYSFFKLEVRELNAASEDWTDLTGGRLFCVKSTTPQAKYNYVRVDHPRNQYEFRLLPVPGSIVAKHWLEKEVYILGGDEVVKFSHDNYKVRLNAYLQKLTEDNTTNPEMYLGNKDSPRAPIDTENYRTLDQYGAINDTMRFDAQTASHLDGPEHSIVYVNEIINQDEPGPQYADLALVGMRLASSKEWSSFAQLSAYVQKGVEVERLIDDDGKATTTLTGPTNNFAEIAYAMLTNTEWGAGEFIGKDAVDRDRMTLAAQYCRANGFTWDGVVGDAVNLRNFIFENAGYALLDFTILGGKFSLAPTCTYNSNFVIDDEVPVTVKALFTDGNIKDLQVTWLGPEERRLFKAVMKYRQEKLNGFPEEKMLSIRLNNDEGGSDYDPEEEFDLTAFCTQREHALKFAKMALRLRQLVDHSVTFQTTPSAALNLAPGEHFRLVSECTHTNRFANGVITAEGMIVSAEGLADDDYNIIYWEPGTTEVKQTSITVKDGKCQQDAVWGVVYTISNSTTSNRVYKVETLTIGEEGFVEIAASVEPVFDGLKMQTLSWNDGYFVIEES